MTIRSLCCFRVLRKRTLNSTLSACRFHTLSLSLSLSLYVQTLELTPPNNLVMIVSFWREPSHPRIVRRLVACESITPYRKLLDVSWCMDYLLAHYFLTDSLNVDIWVFIVWISSFAFSECHSLIFHSLRSLPVTTSDCTLSLVHSFIGHSLLCAVGKSLSLTSSTSVFSDSHSTKKVSSSLGPNPHV